MSRFWPHTPYAEEQPYAHSILTVHVLTRASEVGSLAGTGLGSSIFALRRFNIVKSRIPLQTFPSTVLRSSGIGTVVATALLAVALPLRMRGKEEIEWKDRSWRLLENEGQLEWDDWSYPGMALGLVGAASRAKTLGWRGVVGGAGLGGLLGMLGAIGWREGVRGGSFVQKEP